MSDQRPKDSLLARAKAWIEKMDDGFLYPADRDLWLTAEAEYDLRDVLATLVKELESK